MLQATLDRFKRRFGNADGVKDERQNVRPVAAVDTIAGRPHIGSLTPTVSAADRWQDVPRHQWYESGINEAWLVFYTNPDRGPADVDLLPFGAMRNRVQRAGK